MIDNYDRDGDSRLNYDEIPPQTLHDINLFDVNRDRYLDMDDLGGVR